MKSIFSRYTDEARSVLYKSGTLSILYADLTWRESEMINPQNMLSSILQCYSEKINTMNKKNKMSRTGISRHFGPSILEFKILRKRQKTTKTDSKISKTDKES